jgi:4-hydroxy-3-methylbut-2-enyl diphosphate reductase
MCVERIKLAQEIGFCFGVRQAIEKAKQLSRGQFVHTLGALVHNDQVINKLVALGVKPVTKLADIERGVVAITAHGAPPEVIGQIKDKGLELVDLTCPIVRHAQETCGRMVDKGYEVIIFGDKYHAEVKGLLGYCHGKGIATLNWGLHFDEVEKLAIVSQTTQNRSSFLGFAGSIQGKTGLQEILIFDTTCEFVQRRQAEAIQMAREVDVMLVIGSKTSANTKNLASLCSQYCATRHIEDETDLRRLGELSGRIGICAGTSTPYGAVIEVVKALEQ